MEKTILCYGDSNTWGLVPGSANYQNMYMQRYSRHERWTGLLQEYLGSKYYVVEEGLNGRTTNLDYHFPPDRNGKTYLPSCLYSHAPIDLVILALGGNDLKIYFNRTSKEICDGLNELIDIIQCSKYGKDMQHPPETLIVTPFIPLVECENYIDDNKVQVFKNAIKTAKELIDAYRNISESKKCYLLDISSSISPSNIDGLHIDQYGHKKMALVVRDKIISILQTRISIK